jgi:UDP-N-acetylmuramoylalanine--D-glutamate ligase
MNNELNKYRSFSVIGAARSGVAAAKLLRNKGYDVFLSDFNPENKINSDFVKEIIKNSIDHEFGTHSEKVFENDIIVVSPGVPQNSEVLEKAFSRGKEVISEIELASWFCKGKIISITGTNGKTTTTTLIGKIFEDGGKKAYVCGNIGTAFCDVADGIGEDEAAIVETSSFQLDNIQCFKPYVSIILNITPDHLDRYEKSIDNYISSKLKVTANQDDNDYFIFNYDDEVIKQSIDMNIKARKIPFSIRSDPGNKYSAGAYLQDNRIIYYNSTGKHQLIETKKLIIKGQHNIYNSMASIIASKIFKIKDEDIERTLTGFKGVEHRLEFVRELNGVKFYNDSKATNVNSVWYALQGFTEPIVLILGGRDKGNDYTEIQKEVEKYVKHIVALGESRDKVYNFFKDIVPVTLADDMEDAVRKAYGKAGAKNIVLLSPACASFDQFENYEHRGREFKRIVNEL